MEEGCPSGETEQYSCWLMDKSGYSVAHIAEIIGIDTDQVEAHIKAQEAEQCKQQ